MCRSAFDALDRDWATFIRSRVAVAALQLWSADSELVASGLEELVTRIWAAPSSDADRRCAVLARRARSDVVAARVLLHVLRPGLRNLGRRLVLGAASTMSTGNCWPSPGSGSGPIRSSGGRHPSRRRSSSTCASSTSAAWLVPRPGWCRSTISPARRSPTAPSAEHEAIDAHEPNLRRAHARLSDAVDRGAITSVSAIVVWRTRVQEVDDAAVAAELGVGLRSLQRRRQQAECQVAARARHGSPVVDERRGLLRRARPIERLETTAGSSDRPSSQRSGGRRLRAATGRRGWRLATGSVLRAYP